MSAVEQLRAELRDPATFIKAVEGGLADLITEANAPKTTNAGRAAGLVMAEIFRAGLEFARQAIDRAPVSAGKVKGLDFQETSNRPPTYDTGITPWGRWRVAYRDDCWMVLSGQGIVIAQCDSKEAGIAAAQADFAARILTALQPGDGWQGMRPMSDAPKGRTRTPILARIRADLAETDPHYGMSNAAAYAGRYVVVSHPGVAEDGFDIGWSLHGPFGHGLGSDSFFEGWWPLPASLPQGEDRG